MPALPPSSRMDHEKYAKYLAKYWGRVFERNSTKKQSIIDEINHEFAAGEVSTEKQRATILSNKLFTLSDSLRQDERFNKKYELSKAPAV